MRLDLWSKALPQVAADCLVAGVFEDGDPGDAAAQLDAATGGSLRKMLARGDFAGRLGETALLPDLPGLAASRVLLTGLGARKSYSRKSFRRASAAAFAALSRTGIRSAAFGLDRPAAKELDDYYFCKCIAELAHAALYRVNDLKTGKKPKNPTLDTILAGPVRASAAEVARRGFEHGTAVALGMRVQRDLANLPANICTPTYLADQARELGKRYKSVQVKVLDEAAIRREKMGCLLAVAQGSVEPPRFIVLDYRGGRAKQAPVVLVGKGITFDTGGISLKDPPSMDEMKFDMTGAAAVIGALTLVAELGLPLHAGQPRREARRRRDERSRAQRRDPQHGRRRPAHSRGRAALCAPLRAGGGDRHRDADRRLRDCARRAPQRALRQ
jgi:leucyl aminopeptidase